MKDNDMNRKYRNRVDRHYRRQELPYGIWYTQNGRKILFNRNYLPILEMHETHTDGLWTTTDRREWVHEIVFEGWFYDDSFGELEKCDAAEAALQAVHKGLEPVMVNQRNRTPEPNPDANP